MNYILKQVTKTSVLALLFICIGNTISFAQTTCLKPFPQIARFPQYGNSGETRCVGDQLTLSPIASNTTNNPNFNPPIRVKWYKSGVPYNENIDPLRNEIKFESLKATDAGNYTIRTFYVSDDIDSTTCFAEKSYNVRVSMIPELHLDKREICLDDLVENGVRFSITGDSPSFDLVATVYEPRSSDGFPFLEPVYDPNSERTGVLKIPPGVIEAGIKVGERYDITNLSGANCHTDYSSIVDSILVDVSTEVELITNASCDLQTEIATVSSILPNTGDYEIVSQIPATGSIVNNVYTNSFLASGVVNYEYIIGNSLGCGSSSQTISNTIDCSCDVTGVLSLAVGSNDTISSGETTVLEVTPNGSFDGASSVYTVIITDGTTDYTVTNIAGGVHQFEVSSQGTYSIKSISDGNCERTGAGSVIIIEEETLAFTQNLSGDSLKICAGELINLQVVATGSNLTYQWKRNWVDIPGETSSSFTSPITASGHYLVVVNGDNGIIESESVYISFYEEVDVTTSTLCASEPTLGGITLSENEFQIVVAVNQGDKTTLDITETSTAGVVFTETSAGSGIWYSDAIEVSNFVDLRVTDFNHCNNGVFITGINKTCECQFSGVFSFLNSKNTLCPGIGDGVVLQVEPSGSINATATYDVVLTDGVNDFVPFNVSEGISQFEITEPGNYKIKSISDGGCTNQDYTTSVAIELLDNAVIVTQPVDKEVCELDYVSFTVNATGGNLSYQWKKDGINVIDDGLRIFGSNEPILRLDTIKLSDAGLYSVEVSGRCNYELSNDVELNVNTVNLPAVSLEVTKDSVCEGETVVFSATEVENGMYRFKKEDQTILQQGSSNVFIYPTEGNSDHTFIEVSVSAGFNCLNNIVEDSVKAYSNVFVSPLPEVNASVDGIEVIQTSFDSPFIFLSGSHTAWYASWSYLGPDSDGVNITDPENLNTQVTLSKKGLYEIELVAKNANCEVRDTVTIDALITGLDYVVSSSESSSLFFQEQNDYDDIQLMVFDLNGRVIMDKNLNSESNNLSNLETGIYIYKLNFDHNTRVKTGSIHVMD